METKHALLIPNTHLHTSLGVVFVATEWPGYCNYLLDDRFNRCWPINQNDSTVIYFVDSVIWNYVCWLLRWCHMKCWNVVSFTLNVSTIFQNSIFHLQLIIVILDNFSIKIPIITSLIHQILQMTLK